MADQRNLSSAQSLDERKKYIHAYNSTMIKIWKEKIVKLKVLDTGRLYRSVTAIGMNADLKYIDVTLRQAFIGYGLCQDYGTGSNTPKGNPGDLGHDNRRIRRRWFSKKHFASVMNLREFYAENIGQHAASVISDSLSRQIRSQFGSSVGNVF